MSKPSKMRWGLFFKDSSFAKLKFEYSINMSTAAGAGTAVQGIQWKGNSLTPTFSTVNGAGITASPARSVPVGNVTLFSLYNTYKIFGSKVSMQIIPALNNANAEPVWVTLIPTSSQQTKSNLLTADVMSALPYTRKRLITATSNTTSKSVWMKQYMSTRKIEGVTKAEFEDTDYRANTGADPAKVWFWSLLFNNFTGNNLSNNDYYLHVTETFYVKYYGKIQNPATQ